MKRGILLAVGCLVLLSGCCVNVFYREEEVTPITEPPQPAVVKGISWATVLEIFSTFDSVPKAAIKEKVGYKRSMGLFRVEKASTSESKAEKQGEDYKTEKKQELK